MNPNTSRLRLLRPYLDSAPPAYRNVLRFAKATFEENKKLREELLLRQTVPEKLSAAAAKRAKKIKAKNLVVFDNKYEALDRELKPCPFCVSDEAEGGESHTNMRLSALG